MIIAIAFFLPLLLLIGAGCSGLERVTGRWWELRRDSSGQAPDPAETREGVIQVYAARTVGWRGALAVHTWISLKPSGAAAYTRYEVIGWGVSEGAPAVRVNRSGPDNYWFGSRPDLLVDRRGEGVDETIKKVEAAVSAYPYPQSYTTWPGPNSNTFTAHVGRAVPELRLTLPPTAIGKDYLPGGALAALSPSGTGVQLSLFGLGGLLAGWDEGLELNLLLIPFSGRFRPRFLLLIRAWRGRKGRNPLPLTRARARSAVARSRGRSSAMWRICGGRRWR